MGLGILDYLELALIVALAVPIGLLGVQFLVQGSTGLGVAFVGLSAAMVILKFYLPSPSDVPKEVAQKSVGAIAKEERENEE